MEKQKAVLELAGYTVHIYVGRHGGHWEKAEFIICVWI